MIRAAPAWCCVAFFSLGCGGSDAPEPTGPAEPSAAETSGRDARIRAVEAAMNEHSAAIHECWAKAVAEDLSYAGEVVLEVSIADGGAAESVEVERDTTGSAPLSRCLVSLWEAHVWPPGSFREGELLVLPPHQFVAQSVQFAVSSEHVQARELAGGGRARVVLHPQNTGNDDASLTELHIPAGAAAMLPRGADAAALLYVVEGKGRLPGVAVARDFAASIGAGDAVYAPPGSRLEVEAGEGAALRLLLAYAPAGPEEELGSEAEKLGGEAAPRVRRAGDVEAHAIAGGLGEVSIYIDEEAVGDRSASLGVLTAGPTMVVPPHTHDDASEYLYLLTGAGSMRAGDETFRVEAGMGIQVPPGVEHAFEVEGDEPVRAVQIYAPAGPEQRFKDASP